MTPLFKLFSFVCPSLGLAFAAVEGVGVEKVAGYGILTAILWWFMQTVDRRLGRIEHNLNGMRRTILIDILARSNDGTVKRLCHEELRKVDPNLASEFDPGEG